MPKAISPSKAEPQQVQTLVLPKNFEISPEMHAAITAVSHGKSLFITGRAGPASFFWMTEIAAQLSILSAAQINGIPTNVNVELGESATPEGVVEVVVRN